MANGLGSVEIHLELMRAAQALMIAAKLRSVLSVRKAMRRKSFRSQKKFSTKCRHLYISSSIVSGSLRCGRWEMQMVAPRAFISSMIQLLSKALSAKSASNDRPWIRGATPTVS